MSRGTNRSRGLVSLVVAAAAILAVGVSAGMSAGPEPKIEFEEYEWDFGAMYQKEEQSHTFVFKNTGDADLVVHRTKTSCGCTAAVATEEAIPPGGKGEIRVTYNSKTTKGTQQKTITVYSNAPDSVTTVVVKAEVHAAVDVPRSVQFGTISGEQDVEQVVDVTAEAGLSFQIVKVESDAPFITTSFEPAESKADEGPKYKVRVSISADTPPGRVNNRLRIFTNLEKKPVIEVPIYATVSGRLKCEPEAVNFGTFEPGSDKEVVVTLEAPVSHPIHVTSVRSSTPDVIATLNTLKDGRSYEIVCSVSSSKQSGRVNGKLIIETSDPSEARRELRMIGFVKS